MPKPALGRGLGSLLKSLPRTPAQAQAQAQADAEGNVPVQRVEVTPGVAALIEGTRELREPEKSSSTPIPIPIPTPASASASAASASVSLPRAEAEALPTRMAQAASNTALRGLLVGADFLLCLQAFLFIHRAAAVQVHELLLCIVAVVLGAALACVAFSTRRA